MFAVNEKFMDFFATRLVSVIRGSLPFQVSTPGFAEGVEGQAIDPWDRWQ